MSFKTAIQEYGKEITASFVCNGVTYSGNRIVTMNPHYEGKMFSTVMRCMDIQLEGVQDLYSVGAARAGVAVAGVAVVGLPEVVISSKAEIRSPVFGVKAPGDYSYSYKEFGTYIVNSQKYDDDTQTLNLECYDLMLQSMIPYDLVLDRGDAPTQYNGEQPTQDEDYGEAPIAPWITVMDLLDAICVRLNWTPGYTDFTNSWVEIDRDIFDSSYTFRDVLDQIAQVAAGVIAFKDDKLCVLYPTSTGETIDASNLRSLTIGEKYGPVNSVVLARTPQEDNIYAFDEESVTENGLTEIKIENNQIMDSHREDFIDAILERVNGLEFWMYDLQSFGIGYLDLCDLFTLQTLDGTEHLSLMLNDDMQITQSLAENSVLEAPEATETDYKAASKTDKLLNKTILKVDKQAGEITAIVSRTEALEGVAGGLGESISRMSEVMMDSEKVAIKISEAIEGINSVKTETGYTFDKDGLHIHKSGEEMENKLDNTGMYVNRGEDNILTANNEGVDAINLRSRQFLIVGDYSRFENYDGGTGGNRTACFYIGG